MRHSLSLTLALFAFGGCANHAGVTPSQNPTLNALSPSTTAASEGGVMQHNLDGWLKEEWTPMTAEPSAKTTKTITSTAPDGTVVTTTVETAPEPEEGPITMQKFVDKWKTYHENQAKMNEGKPKEASHSEKIEELPVIGK